MSSFVQLAVRWYIHGEQTSKQQADESNQACHRAPVENGRRRVGQEESKKGEKKGILGVNVYRILQVRFLIFLPGTAPTEGLLPVRLCDCWTL